MRSGSHPFSRSAVARAVENLKLLDMPLPQNNSLTCLQAGTTSIGLSRFLTHKYVSKLQSPCPDHQPQVNRVMREQVKIDSSSMPCRGSHNGRSPRSDGVAAPAVEAEQAEQFALAKSFSRSSFVFSACRTDLDLWLRESGPKPGKFSACLGCMVTSWLPHSEQSPKPNQLHATNRPSLPAARPRVCGKMSPQLLKRLPIAPT